MIIRWSLLSLIVIFLLFSLAVNRRLDEWVKLEQLDLDSVEAVVDEKVEEKVMNIYSNLYRQHLLDLVNLFSEEGYGDFLRKR